MPVRGIRRFSKENLLSHGTEKLLRGTFLCFTKSLVSEVFMDQRGEGEDGRSIATFCQTFFVSQYRKTPWGNISVFTNFLVSKNFMNKRWGMKEGGALRLSVKKNF